MAMEEGRRHPGRGGGRHAAVAGSGARPARRPAYRGDLRSRDGGSMETDGERLATALGGFSIGLGLAQLAAPGGVARLIGVGDGDRNRQAMRAVGLREIASGVGILSRSRPAGWLWARVGGDVMDLALLGAAAVASDHPTRGDRVAAATAAVAGIAALDLLCAQRLGDGGDRGRTAEAALERWRDRSAPRDHAVRVTRVITIGRPAEELYRFWRDFENLPRIMGHLEEVRVLSDRRSHWRAKAPLGRTVEWDAELVEDRPNQRLAWRSLPGGDVDNAGSVAFERAPGGRGTVVRVELAYDPPGGAIGATIARLFGREPGQEVQEDLRAFKQVMETGEVVQSDATAKGGGPARPPAA